MLDRILVPLDTSKVAEQVLPYATMLARQLKQPIVLCSVVADVSRSGLANPLDSGHDAALADFLARRTKYAQDYLDRIKAQVSAQGLMFTSDVAAGDVAENIVKTAAAGGSGMIAMATHGRVGPERWFLGSIADKVVRSSPIPVLLIRPQEDQAMPEPAIRHILVPLDGSTQSQTALPYASFLARTLGVPVTVIQTVSLTAFAGAATDPYGVDETAVTPELTEIMEDQAQSYIDEVSAKLRDSGIQSSTAFSFLPPESELEEQARAHPGSLIVMSTHGRSGIGRALLGSVTDRVIRSSVAPVLVVRAPDDEG